jgi:hypothetical protein
MSVNVSPSYRRATGDGGDRFHSPQVRLSAGSILGIPFTDSSELPLSSRSLPFVLLSHGPLDTCITLPLWAGQSNILGPTTSTPLWLGCAGLL